MPKLFSIPRIQQIPRSGKSAALAALTCLGLSQSLQAESACLGAPPLAAPTGTVVNVSSAQELNSAINNLSDNTTILLEPGDYSLVSTLYIRRSNITLRGNSDSCDAVVLLGHTRGKHIACINEGEERLELMIAILPPPADMQREVDLGVGGFSDGQSWT